MAGMDGQLTTSTFARSSVTHADDLDPISLLFSESQGRVILSVRGGDVHRVLDAAAGKGIPATRVGTTGGETLTVRRRDVELINTKTVDMQGIWRNAFAALLAGDSIDDILRGTRHEEDIIVA